MVLVERTPVLDKFARLLGGNVMVVQDYTDQPDSNLEPDYPRAARGLVMVPAGVQAKVVITSATDPQYVNWLHGVGLGVSPSATITLPHQREKRLATQIIETPGSFDLNEEYLYFPFFSSQLGQQAAVHLGVKYLCDPLAALAVWDKAEVLDLLGNAVQRAAGSHVDRSGLRSKVASELSLHGCLFVRGTKGCAGHSAYKVEALEQVQEILKQDSCEVFLVEAYIPHTVSPNVQAIVFPGGSWEFLGWSDQILVNGAHIGNRSSSVNAGLLQKAAAVFDVVAKTGFVGVVGADFLVHRDTEEIFFCEVNGRVNGSTCLFLAREKLLSAGRIEEDWDFSYFSASLKEPASLSHLSEILGEKLFSPRGKGGFVLPLSPEGNMVYFSLFFPNQGELLEVESGLRKGRL